MEMNAKNNLGFPFSFFAFIGKFGICNSRRKSLKIPVLQKSDE
jgi:hypothetical protein